MKITYTYLVGLVLLVAPFSAMAMDFGVAGYGGGGDSFLFPTGGNAPRAELYVHSWGPTSASQNMNMGTYRPAYTNTQAVQYPAQYSYAAPMYATQSYVNNFQLQQYAPMQYNPYVNTASYMPYTYNQPQYNGAYNTPSYGYTNSYYTPEYSYGYGGGYSGGYGGTSAPSSGLKDFWGNDMCYWGSDYGNFPCDRDPHQWVQDPYSGSWY